MDAWRRLVQTYKPDEARICNCGQAYEYQCVHGYVRDGDGMVETHNLWGCPNGCSANQIAARDHVARCILTDASQIQPIRPGGRVAESVLKAMNRAGGRENEPPCPLCGRVGKCGRSVSRINGTVQWFCYANSSEGRGG